RGPRAWRRDPLSSLRKAVSIRSMRHSDCACGGRRSSRQSYWSQASSARSRVSPCAGRRQRSHARRSRPRSTRVRRLRLDDQMDALEPLIARVRAEYHEMPGLSLTTQQAARLWGMHLSLCERVLKELVLRGVLYNTPSGAYAASPPTRDRV